GRSSTRASKRRPPGWSRAKLYARPSLTTSSSYQPTAPAPHAPTANARAGVHADSLVVIGRVVVRVLIRVGVRVAVIGVHDQAFVRFDLELIRDALDTAHALRGLDRSLFLLFV